MSENENVHYCLNFERNLFIILLLIPDIQFKIVQRRKGRWIKHRCEMVMSKYSRSNEYLGTYQSR